MTGGTGRLPGRVIPSLYECFTAETFFVGLAGTFKGAHINNFKQYIFATPAQFCPGRDRMKCLYEQKRPAKGGIPPMRDGIQNVPPPYKRKRQNTIELYTSWDLGNCPVPVNVPSRLSYKQPLRGKLACYNYHTKRSVHNKIKPWEYPNYVVCL